MNHRFKLLVVLSLVINFFILLQIEAAPLTFTVFPIKQIVNLLPDTLYSDNFTIINSNNFPLEITVDKEDFVPSPGTANIDFVPKAPGTTSLVDWLSVPAKVELKPGETKLVPYTIAVPVNPEPGSHFAAVFFKATPSGSQAFSTSIRIGSIFLASLPGPVKKTGELLGFSTPGFARKGPVSFGVIFKNTGTVHYAPSGDIKIFNFFGSQIADVPLDSQIILPTGVKTISQTWAVNYGFGPYTAKLDVQDGDNNHYFSQTQVWLIPWPEILGGIGVIILIWLFFKYLGSRFTFQIAKKQ